MTERDAFMQDICEAPQDDSPRLIFADWLEEQGEPERSEFIRVQCELAKYPRVFSRDPTDCMAIAIASHVSQAMPGAWGELARRERELYRHAPTIQWGEGELPDGWKCVWRRGFIAEITLSCAAWLEHRERLMRATPLEKVTLTGAQAFMFIADKIICIRPSLPSDPASSPRQFVARKGELWEINESQQKARLAKFHPTGRGIEFTQADVDLSFPDEDFRILFGDGSAPQPLGVINAPRRRR